MAGHSDRNGERGVTRSAMLRNPSPNCHVVESKAACRQRSRVERSAEDPRFSFAVDKINLSLDISTIGWQPRSHLSVMDRLRWHMNIRRRSVFCGFSGTTTTGPFSFEADGQ